MIIEIKGTRKTAKENYKRGFFIEWTPERIKGAFANGTGSMDDLKKYARNNKLFCAVVDTEKGVIL